MSWLVNNFTVIGLKFLVKFMFISINILYIICINFVHFVYNFRCRAVNANKNTKGNYCSKEIFGGGVTHNNMVVAFLNLDKMQQYVFSTYYNLIQDEGNDDYNSYDPQRNSFDVKFFMLYVLLSICIWIIYYNLVSVLCIYWRIYKNIGIRKSNLKWNFWNFERELKFWIFWR